MKLRSIFDCDLDKNHFVLIGTFNCYYTEAAVDKNAGGIQSSRGRGRLPPWGIQTAKQAHAEHLAQLISVYEVDGRNLPASKGGIRVWEKSSVEISFVGIVSNLFELL